MEEEDLSIDMDDEDLSSDESSKDAKDKKPIEDSSFTTENIINYGKEYQNLDKIYTKSELNSFYKILNFKKLNSLNDELDSYKKEKINWKYLYNNIFKMILLPINLNKVDINKTINIYEISQRIRYCIHCIATMKDKNIEKEKKNLIPRIIDMFTTDKNKPSGLKTKFQNFINNNKNEFDDNSLKKSNSHENFFFDKDNVSKEIDNKNDNENINNNKFNLNILNDINKNTNNNDKNDKDINNNHLESEGNVNNSKKNININNKIINIIKEDFKCKENCKHDEDKDKKRKNKTHITINIGKKIEEKLFSKNIFLNKDIKKSNNNFKNHSYKKFNKKNIKFIILENLEKKKEFYENIIKNIPKMSDDILFETKQKKPNIQNKRNAYMETMTDFNLKNLNMEIKDKTFCENVTFFPIKQTYDKENDLEKRGERILSYKKMADNLIDLLKI